MSLSYVFLVFLFSVADPDRIYPHHFGNLDPHQIKIRIRIKLDPETDTHKLADDKSKCTV
jgi:hypothetical protein